MKTNFLNKLPKAELHVHFDGTLTPEQIFLFAKRNNVTLPYKTLNELQQVYKDMSRDYFYTTFFTVTSVLQTEQDFYEVMWHYIQKAADQGVMHAEIFFDTQSYIARGILVETMMAGFERALIKAEKELGMTSFLILCFLRHLSEEKAFEDLESILPYRQRVIAVGLAADAQNNPPSKFERVFKKAREYGFKLVAHAGETDGPAAVYEAINLLTVDRVDHGVQCWQDPLLVQELVQRKIPLTICPLSNIVLGVFKKITDMPLKKMYNAGLRFSINSDDPSYFGGYIADNYQAVYDAGLLTEQELIQCARVSFESSFMSKARKEHCIQRLQNFLFKNR